MVINTPDHERMENDYATNNELLPLDCLNEQRRGELSRNSQASQANGEQPGDRGFRDQVMAPLAHAQTGTLDFADQNRGILINQSYI